MNGMMRSILRIIVLTLATRGFSFLMNYFANRKANGQSEADVIDNIPDENLHHENLHHENLHHENLHRKQRRINHR